MVEEVIQRVPVRQWVLSFAIPLRMLLAVHTGLLTPVLRIIHRVITGFVLKQAGPMRATADTGAATGSFPGSLIFNTRAALHGVADDPARPALAHKGQSASKSVSTDRRSDRQNRASGAF